MDLSKIYDLRTCIEFLETEAPEHLVRINTEVSSKYELAGVSMQVDGGPALLFEKIKGYNSPVFTNFFSNRERIGKIFGTSAKLPLTIKFLDALEHPVEPRIVDDGPCKENIIEQDIDLMKLFPIIHACEKDGGFFMQPIWIVKDPETGMRDVSFARAQVTWGDTSIGKNKMYAQFGPGGHIGSIIDKAESLGKPLEMAAFIGANPAEIFAGALGGPMSPLGFDEFSMSGGLLGRPVELVKCETVDVEVPADAEIVIEGKPRLGERVKEGAFHELAEYYGTSELHGGRCLPFDITAVTFRNNPIYYPIIGRDRLGLRKGHEAQLYKHVKQTCPIVEAVHLPYTGTALVVPWISITKKKPAHEGMQYYAMFAAASFASGQTNMVYCVDSDVDIYNSYWREWALSTRLNLKNGVHVIPFEGWQSTSMVRVGRTGTMLVDATVPYEDMIKKVDDIGIFEKVKYPKVDIAKYFKDWRSLRVYQDMTRSPGDFE